ncbi:hypothetical protein ACC811_37090, partial [Rhizobium ruizarguesonis]
AEPVSSRIPSASMLLIVIGGVIYSLGFILFAKAGIRPASRDVNGGRKTGTASGTSVVKRPGGDRLKQVKTAE